jgi:hypothetical protein
MKEVGEVNSRAVLHNPVHVARRGFRCFLASLILAVLSLPSPQALAEIPDDTTSGNISSLEGRVTAFVSHKYPDGVPYARGRELGAAALPLLTKTLEDTNQKGYWTNAVSGIGA